VRSHIVTWHSMRVNVPALTPAKQVGIRRLFTREGCKADLRRDSGRSNMFTVAQTFVISESCLS